MWYTLDEVWMCKHMCSLYGEVKCHRSHMRHQRPWAYDWNVIGSSEASKNSYVMEDSATIHIVCICIVTSFIR